MKRKIVSWFGALAVAAGIPLVALPLTFAGPASGQTGDEAATDDTATDDAEASDEATVGDAVEAPAEAPPPEPESEPPPEPEAAPPRQAPPPEKKDDLFADDDGPEIPTSQYASSAEEWITEMRAQLKKALDTLASAREAKDAVRLNCVNDKVTAMKGILRISEDSYISLQEALSAKAMEKARYEFGKIRVSKRKMTELATAAQNCAGAEASYTGGTDVKVEIDDQIVGGDPYYGDPDFFNVPEDNVVDGEGDTVGNDDPPDAQPPLASPVS